MDEQFKPYHKVLKFAILMATIVGIGICCWNKRKNHDSKFLLTLAKCTDIQLRRIIVHNRQSIEQSIKEVMVDIRQSLLDETDHKRIRTQSKCNGSIDDSKIILDIVLEKGARAQRTMFIIFSKKPKNISKLKIITEILTRWAEGESMLEEIELQHKDSFFIQNEKLTVKTTGGNEKIRRIFLDEMYTDVRIVAPLRVRRLVENELKALGREREELQRKNIENELREFQLDQLFSFPKTGRSRTTAVIGAAGIGKSTMIQKIIRDWAAGKIYQQFKFVFHFNVRNLNLIEGKTCLNSIILDSYPDFENTLEVLMKEPGNILFIFDDLDGLRQTIDFTDNRRNNDPQNQCFDPECCCEISDILRCLINGELLNGCSVLITSRPWRLESLEKANTIARVEILGFGSENIKHYFRSYFGDEQFATDVIEYIEQNETLYTMCYNPLYCSVLASLFDSHRTEGAVHRPLSVTTSTRGFLAYVRILLEKCGCDAESSRDMLLKLGELAYKGVSNKTIVFNENQISPHSLELHNVISAFMMEIQAEGSCRVTYAFTHSVVRDFVAAIMKFLNTAGYGLTALLNEGYTCIDERFNIFEHFLVGLSTRFSADQLKSTLGTSPPEAFQCVADWLTENVKRRVQNLEDRQSQRTFLKLLHYFIEFGDLDLMKATLTPIKIMKFTKCRLKHSDCAVISTALTAVEFIEELNLSSCDVQDEGIHKLEPVLHKCKILRLNENKLGESGVKRLSAVLKKHECKIQRLELKSNGLTDDCVESLFTALRVNRSLMELELSNDNQDGEEANRLTEKSVSALRNLLQSGANLKETRPIQNEDIAEEKQILTAINKKD